MNQKVIRSIPSQGTCLGGGPSPPLSHLSLSLPLPLKISLKKRKHTNKRSCGDKETWWPFISLEVDLTKNQICQNLDLMLSSLQNHEKCLLSKMAKTNLQLGVFQPERIIYSLPIPAYFPFSGLYIATCPTFNYFQTRSSLSSVSHQAHQL